MVLMSFEKEGKRQQASLRVLCLVMDFVPPNSVMPSVARHCEILCMGSQRDVLVLAKLALVLHYSKDCLCYYHVFEIRDSWLRLYSFAYRRPNGFRAGSAKLRRMPRSRRASDGRSRRCWLGAESPSPNASDRKSQTFFGGVVSRLGADWLEN